MRSKECGTSLHHHQRNQTFMRSFVVISSGLFSSPSIRRGSA